MAMAAADIERLIKERFPGLSQSTTSPATATITPRRSCRKRFAANRASSSTRWFMMLSVAR